MNSRTFWAIAAIVVIIVIGVIIGTAASAHPGGGHGPKPPPHACAEALQLADELIEKYGFEHQFLINNLTGPNPDPSQLGDLDGLGEAISAFYTARDACPTPRGDQ